MMKKKALILMSVLLLPSFSSYLELIQHDAALESSWHTWRRLAAAAAAATKPKFIITRASFEMLFAHTRRGRVCSAPQHRKPSQPPRRHVMAPNLDWSFCTGAA